MTNDDRNSHQTATGQQPIYMVYSPESSGSVSLIELIPTLWRRRWVIIGITASFVVMGVVFALLATPIYRSEVALLAAESDQTGNIAARLGGLASLAGINLARPTDSRQRALATLRSRAFIEEFIEDNDLLPVLFVDQWDTENARWIGDNPEDWPNTLEGVEFFVENVRSVSEDAATGLVTLSIDWTDPELAAQWAEALVSRINEQLRARDLRDSERRLEYLNAQLEKANLIELRQAISGLIEDQLQTIMLAQAEVEYAFRVIDPPRVPNQRESPRRTLIVFISGLLGGLVSVLSVTLYSALRKERDADRRHNTPPRGT